MGPDYQQPVADVDYRQGARTDSTAEAQLEVFTFHGYGISGPIDAVWIDRQDVP